MFKDSIAQDDLEFERRMQARYRRWAEEARRLEAEGRRWRCERCGEAYDARWVAWNGRRCNAECDGHLREVRGAGEHPGRGGPRGGPDGDFAQGAG